MTKETEDTSTPHRREEIARIGSVMAKMRLLTGRRYIGRLAISRAGGGLELHHLDVLTLVRRLSSRQEVTVGAIAEQMRIDHSRASRLIAELVRLGNLRREVSQEDARRTIVALTAEGTAWLDAVQAVKYEVLEEVLGDWSDEDLAAFADLYLRFTQKLEDQADDFDAQKASTG